MKKIYLLVGDPNNDTEKKSLATLLALEYVRGATESGFELRYTHLASMNFDPILHKGYRVIQSYEPDLVKFQEDVKWADHVVIIHPVWWATTPALLKGLFDRAWMPGFAFNMWKTGLFKGLGWTGHLKGKSAHIIQTSGAYPLAITLLFGSSSRLLKDGILGFAGISPIKVTKFGPVERAPAEKVTKWLKKVYEMGKKGK